MDKYEKVKKIGEGSFGKAILVKSKEDGRPYVIKEIGISGMPSKERQESRKEVAVLAKMSHPNIVQYKESFEEAGSLYIVMDYCEGGDLFKKINSQKGVLFSEEQILDWFVQICLALKHVHDRKILHRDIKSQNIFLTKDGTIQLGDFGIARVLNSTVELMLTTFFHSNCESHWTSCWLLGAGNMKNLVLKIIRGSYPPVSVHYSHELRSLLAQLFKRNPRERPSVSSILDKSFLSCRIERFLTPQLIAQEFRHTFLHKQPKIAKRPAPGFIPLTPAQKITKPATKYGVPLTVRKVSDAARKSAERKPAVKHKPVSTPQRRAEEEERKKHEDGIRKKRMELIEKERKQREQMFLLKAEQMKRYEKEKINRINQAREQGWKHVLSSSGGSSPERKCFVGGGKRAAGVPPFPSKTPYEHYHAALDQMAKPHPKDISREGSSAGPGVPAAAGPVLPNGTARLNPDAIKRELQRLQLVSIQARINRQRGQTAAERAGQVEEFLQRKREAMINKVRAEGQLEYLKKLRQIRLLNFNERQQIKARLRGEKYDSDGSDSQESSEEAELRRKKIEALKAQANARAAVLKEQLEKKRREAYEREKRAWEDHVSSFIQVSNVSTWPYWCISLSSGLILSFVDCYLSFDRTTFQNNEFALIQYIVILHIITCFGSSLTIVNFLCYTSSYIQFCSIFLHPYFIPPATSASPEDESVGDRKKWEAGVPLVLSVAQQTLEETCFTTIEQTAGEVIQMAVPQEEAPRKAWGVSPHSQVLRVLQEAELQPLTQQLENVTVSFHLLILQYIFRTVQSYLGLILSDPADIESVVLEDTHKQASPRPAGVQQAWEQEAQKSVQLLGFSFSTLLIHHNNRLHSIAHIHFYLLNIYYLFLSVIITIMSLFVSHAQMLRTCSLPDLSRLFSSQQDSGVTSDANVAPDNNLEIEDLEEAAKDDDAYEDEDLRDIRASMERLLQEEAGAGDFNGNPPDGEDHELFNRIAAEIDQDNQMAVDDEDDDDDENDEEEEEEEEEAENHDSIFSRLEELRFNLEQQMGFEKFIEAYNKIKAIHEDEDENIDLGSSLVLSILGTEHQHLYPNILHLVMADGAYQEDNDE
uniref:non-specific serine/threonine protein kinase n=1 Tax=Anabas testudineus TaxID=64144 RepID=A0A7N6B229_ANATE